MLPKCDISRLLLSCPVLLGVAMFIGVALYTFYATPEYTAQATVQYTSRETQPDDKEGFSLYGGSGYMDTLFGIGKSEALVTLVSERIKDEDRANFLEPYGSEIDVADILMKNREIVWPENSNILLLRYTHFDPSMAAKVANYFAEELINYQVKLYIETSMRAVEDLRIRTDHQLEKIEALKAKLDSTEGDEVATLTEDVATQETIYHAMKDRLQTEMSQVDGDYGYGVRVIDKASPPSQPSKPDVARNLLFGALPLPFLLVIAFIRYQRQ